MQLTPSQQKAVTHRATRNLLLVACAGSGKTEVVARRIVALLEEGCPPSGIIAFTFTEKAATALKHRITERCKDVLPDLTGLAEMYVGTQHAFCLDLLKTEVPKYLKYDVFNEVQQTLFIDRHSTQAGLTTSRTLDGKSLKRWIDTKTYVQALAVLREAALVPEALAGCSVADGLEMYRMLMDAKGYLDYSGILSATEDALRTQADLRDRLAARVKHLIVDEYQDLNPVQERIVRALHDLGASVTVVGDDDQTIYQWRGSDVHNILTFDKRYPNVKRIDLKENFRSSTGVVDLARSFIKQNEERLDKAMASTEAQESETGDLVALAFDDPDEEAAHIARTCRDLHGVAIREGDGQRGISWSDMAVLLRSVKKCGEPIMRALDEAGVPYVIVGMNRLFSTREAQAARLLFHYVASYGDVTAEQVLKAWKEARTGVKPKALQRALEVASEARRLIPLDDAKRRSFYNIQRLFLDFLETAELREDAVPNEYGEILFYNLGKFSQLISDFETIHFKSDPPSKYEAFAKFLQYQAEDAYPEGWQDNAHANPDAVRIMTVHQAKGMQWPVVFVPALVANRFPAAGVGGRTVWHLVPSEGVKGSERFKGTAEDERRLFYVAVTRSQKFLHLTWAPVQGNRRYTRASDFWNFVLRSKYVKRLPVSYGTRKRRPAQPKVSVANVVLSFSDLKYYFECPYQFKLRVLYGFNPPLDEALGFGKSLHDCLAEVHARAIRGDRVKPSEAERLVKAHLRAPFAYQALEEKMRASAERIVRDYIFDNASVFDKIEFSEKPIELSLDDGVSVVGRIDLVRRTDTDETTIIDLKSNQRAQSEDLTEAQLHIYALGYYELTGKRADYVSTYHLEEREQVPRSVDDEMIERVTGQVQTAAKALRKGELPPKPGAQKCRRCDYQRLCRCER